MTSYKFEVAAKKAVIKAALENYGQELTIEDIQMVWFCHTLGFKKAVLVDSDNRNNQRIYEVTYNRDRNELYLDIYGRLTDMVVPVT